MRPARDAAAGVRGRGAGTRGRRPGATHPRGREGPLFLLDHLTLRVLPAVGAHAVRRALVVAVVAGRQRRHGQGRVGVALTAGASSGTSLRDCHGTLRENRLREFRREDAAEAGDLTPHGPGVKDGVGSPPGARSVGEGPGAGAGTPASRGRSGSRDREARSPRPAATGPRGPAPGSALPRTGRARRPPPRGHPRGERRRGPARATSSGRGAPPRPRRGRRRPSRATRPGPARGRGARRPCRRGRRRRP